MTDKYTGGCYCGNITFEMETTIELNSYSPRACDCNFCTKHSASYISDNNGKLTIYIENENNLNRYQQGDEIADFLICKICGVLVGACYKDRECLYATLNSKAVDRNLGFAKDTVVSPKTLNSDRKKQRWQDFWFSDVYFENKRLSR